ncbi:MULTISPECIES: hypothetical protein [unclassified Agarivorans]|uniref:hypothetical protein n=1 Tax=unclassified Agarivorans TaxID=2636026 RepID=UPI0010D8C2B5|nr:MULTISPECIES: hypothetical protein [unclassified Agarivorans]MDO6764710.1 hypothetical protein [Agarivorans sp. 1_MG-2023]GDY24242.1 hypothetical protein AHAT_01320 [Agarivorans sp. Toyoura001]
MTNLNNTLIASAILTALFSPLSFAEEVAAPTADEEFHDADPRNSNWRGGIAADHNGQIKLAAGGGSGTETTQTTLLGEYYTESDNFRFRLAHFDARFGGVYTDLYRVTDLTNMYTAGYMLPLKTAEGTMFFPSINYTYVDWDVDGIGNSIDSNCRNYGDLENGLCKGIADFGGANGTNVAKFLGSDNSHMSSLNLYVLQPWNNTHYTVLNANMGKSFDGVEMNVVNLMWLQGIRTHLGDNILNIYLEVKYDVLEVDSAYYNPISNKGSVKSEETIGTIGFDFRF